MSAATIHKKDTYVRVVASRSFNLHLRNRIEGRIDGKVNRLEVDLGRCRFVDTEAVIFLFRWIRDGGELELVDPPPILYEILDLLELREAWDRNICNQIPDS